MERVWFITGASRGFGRAFTEEAVKRGDKVIATVRRVPHDDIFKHPSVLTVVMDVTKTDEVEKAIKDGMDRFGRIDVLINNAGFGAYGATWDVPLETELNMLDLNVRAVQILTKLFLADFRKRGSGRILNVASSAGFLAGPLMSGYYATKGYVLRLSEAISEELRQEGSRVTVTALCPGHVETNFDARAKVRRSIGGVSAKRVAQAGIEGMLRGKVVVLPGALMKMTYVGEKLLPESWMLKIAYRAQARKG